MSWGDEPPPFDKMPPGKWGGPAPADPAPVGPPRVSVLGEAWQAYQARLGAWLVAMVLVLACYTAVMWLESWIVGDDFRVVVSRGLRAIAPSPGKGLIYAAAAAVINGCLIGGLMRMAIKQWRGEPFGAADVLGIADVLGPLVRVSVLYAVIVSVGYGLCFLPGLVFSAMFMFAAPRVLDGERSGLAALAGSWGMLRGQLVSATIVHTVLTVVLTIGGSLCLIGLLVTGPLYVLSVARLYVERSGIPMPSKPEPAEPTTYL